MKNRVAGWVLLTYAVLVLVGGIMGYVKAQSVASLVFGSISAVLLGISSFLLLQGKQLGFYLGLLLTIVLGAFFAYRFVLSYKFMPAGLMVILSLVTFFALLKKNWRE